MSGGFKSRFTALLGLVHLALTARVPRHLDALSIQLPDFVPQHVSEKVDPDFLGLAFEQASWTRYAMNDDGKLNQFSANLINEIYKRTGGKPIIRLVSTTQDDYEPYTNASRTTGRYVTRLWMVHTRARGAGIAGSRAGQLPMHWVHYHWAKLLAHRKAIPRCQVHDTSAPGQHKRIGSRRLGKGCC